MNRLAVELTLLKPKWKVVAVIGLAFGIMLDAHWGTSSCAKVA